MSTFFAPSQGESGQNDQNFSYTDGNTHVSYSSQSYTWSSSQQSTPMQTPAPIPLQQLHARTMLQMLPPIPDLNQLHQQHMDLHRAGMQTAMQMQQNAMLSMRQSVQFQQPALVQIQMQPQIQYAAHQLPAPQSQPLRIEESPVSARRDDCSTAEKDKQMLDVAQRIEDRLHHSDQQSREQVQVQARNESIREAKENQFRAGQAKLISDLSQQIAELRQSQNAKIQPASPAFDLEALQKIVLEAGNTSRDDMKAFIDDAVRKQLSGVASAADLETAASRMEASLMKVSGAAADAKVQETVRKELTDAINQVARRAPTRDQQWIEAAPGRKTRTPCVETEFTVEEIPEDDDDNDCEPKARRKSSSGRKSRALPAPAQSADESARSTKCADNDQPVVPVAGGEPRTPTYPSNGLARTEPTAIAPGTAKNRLSAPPLERNALARVKHSDHNRSRSSKMSSLSERPPPGNALARLKAREAERGDGTAGKSTKTSTISVQSSDSNALVRPKSSSTTSAPPDPPAGEAQKQDHKASRSSKKSTLSIQPSDSNAVLRATTSDAPKFNSSAEAMEPARANDGRPHDSPDDVSHSTALQRGQRTHKTSTVSSERPRDDCRGETQPRRPTRQLEAVPEESGEGSTALVRHRKDVSRKSRK